jgi:hypothetical protein
MLFALMDDSKFTHTLWMPYYLQGQFFRWYEAGIGYETTDETGVATQHIFEHMYSRGNPSGQSCFLPNGQKPAVPAQKAKRPGEEQH